MAGVSGQLYLFNEYYGPTRGVAGHHFYTSFPERESNMNEFNLNIPDTWALYINQTPPSAAGSLTPVYRLYKIGAGHFYTISTTQRTNAQNEGYLYEGIVGYAYASSGSYRIPIYRYYSPTQNNHWYPKNTNGFVGYEYKQIAWYSPIRVFGCGDSTASNYNRYVNQPSTGCTYYIFGCTDPNASNYNPNANRDDGSCTYPIPTPSLTVYGEETGTITRGETTYLAVSISNFNYAYSAYIMPGNIPVTYNGASIPVSPTQTTVYTLYVTYRGGTLSDTATVRVYIPPVVTLTLDNTTINRGQSTTLRWSTSGDASTMNISPGIGSTNLTSFATVSPTQTTTYTAYASGLGGSDTEQVTLTVLQPPSVSISGPVRVSYGNTVSISYSGTNVTSSFYLFIEYYSLDNNITTKTYQLSTGNSSSGTYTDNISYNNRGPDKIRYTLYGAGSGNLTDTKTIEVDIVIDQTPDVIDIPQSEDKIKDEQPVISPDVEVTTEQIVVTDIDIPVEIRANAPVQIEIDNDGTWRNVREL